MLLCKTGMGTPHYIVMSDMRYTCSGYRQLLSLLYHLQFYLTVKKICIESWGRQAEICPAMARASLCCTSTGPGFITHVNRRDIALTWGGWIEYRYWAWIFLELAMAFPTDTSQRPAQKHTLLQLQLKICCFPVQMNEVSVVTLGEKQHTYSAVQLQQFTDQFLRTFFSGLCWINRNSIRIASRLYSS